MTKRRRAPGSRRSRSWRDGTVTGADARSTFGAVDETSQPRRAPALGRPRRRRARSARRSRTSSARAIRDGALQPGRARAVDARPRAPARRLAARRRRRLRAARRRGLPERCARARARACPTPRGRRARRRRRAPQPAPRAAALRLPPERARTSRPSRARPGCASLREALASMHRRRPRLRRPARRRRCCAPRWPSYLGRVRGVVADPARVVVTCGYSQGLGARLPRARRARRDAAIALEDPSNPEQRADRAPRRARAGPGRRSTTTGCGSTRSPRPAPTPSSLTPAHQHPTGVVLARRAPHRAARAGCASATRSRSRTTTTPSTATTAPPSARSRGSSPTASSTPARRARRSRPRCGSAGSCVPRGARRRRSRDEKLLADRGTARIEQHAFADFLARGELDRHLRRMRAPLPRAPRRAGRARSPRRCPRRRSAGVAAGLHVTVELPDGDDERAIARGGRAPPHRARHAGATTAPARRPARADADARLRRRLPEPAIRAGVRELAEAVRAARG